tara:strand:+ start:1650 stop:1760 length:111 start_codon:yes stop_codon:yes gene_type:complete
VSDEEENSGHEEEKQGNHVENIMRNWDSGADHPLHD